MRIATENAYRIHRRTVAAEERASGFYADKGEIERIVVEVPPGTGGFLDLLRAVGLSRGKNVVSSDRPSPEQVSDEAMLLFKERKLLDQSQSKTVGEVEPGYAVLAGSYI